MNIALILFAVAAVGGVVLALIRFKGKPYPPLALALVHGAVAAAGLVALIALVAQHQGTSSATTALVLFLIAALGGFGLFFHHSEAAGLIIAGLAAVAGFADLIKIPQSETTNAKTALIHAGLALTMLSLFGVAFALRGGAAGNPSGLVLGLEAAGALFLAVTGWFGADLVFRRGVGVQSAEAPKKP